MITTSKKIIKGKRILITGGTGSFGVTMMKKLLDLAPSSIIIFSRDELKQHQMRMNFKSKILQFIIGDIRDFSAIDEAMHGVDYVFHAAALKQVPTAEFFPMEAIKTNILGGENVMKAASKNKAKRVIVLSTDKAVYPINAMGMTKALMEKLMFAYAREAVVQKSSTIYCGVRYGNVMYSRGSVIPYFVELIKNKQKLIVTNPSMTRFLLPLYDSVDLILHALTHGENGSLYIRKSPAATIQILAQALCKLFNYEEKIEIVGVRAGEKLHETLISKEEWMRVIDQKDYYKIPQETEGFNYDTYFSKGKKTKFDKEGYTSQNTQQLNIDQVAKLLMTLDEIKQELQYNK